MACDGLILTSIVPTLILEAVGPVLALESPAPELSLSSDSCILSFPVDIRLTFEVSSPSLELASAPVNLCMTSPVPVGVGEANEAVNCLSRGPASTVTSRASRCASARSRA